MFHERVTRLQAELQARGVQAAALMPGPNLRYLTGLDFHLMERPTVGFFPAEGAPVFAVPGLEQAKFDAGSPLDYEVEVFTYSDEEGPAEAFRRAMDALPELHELAVEHLRMRVAELRLVQRHAPNAVLHNADPIMDALRVRKDANEIELMRQAIAITEKALAEVIAGVRLFDTERAIAGRLRTALIEHGGEALPFEPIVLAGPRAALPHGVPSDRPVRMGDVLLIDFGTSYGGYISDITRTFVVGLPLEGRNRDVYEAVKAANQAGREAARPGATAQDVDRAARKVIEEAGFGEYFIHRTGHGIGLDAHEGPYIVEGNDVVLEPGMTFTVEPGIYIPGEIGVRIEDDVLITPDGAESLTTFDRELIRLDPRERPPFVCEN
ncbi:MAG: Xaa-Pro peptidase family protein [Aggregatilineales bacterium]|nr:aminopeptidase P family protein [Chloroflexota bacterium]HOA24280.1 Xaa-Pro peptidase family protein [Aggregatilineales bacterium]HPV06111.1 Xaa-Pro peptidase family protein [Aggregatilineales bacterium]